VLRGESGADYAAESDGRDAELFIAHANLHCGKKGWPARLGPERIMPGAALR
jgi:hypothetical protein